MRVKEASYAWEDYCADLLAFVRRRLALYRRFAIEASPESGALRVRGTVVYVEDLDQLEEADFSEAEMAAYEQAAAALEREAQAMRLRAASAGDSIALERLAERLALTPFERLALWLALAAELDGRFERVFMFLQDDFNLKRPTLDFCLRCFSLRQQERLEILRQLLRRAGVLDLLFGVPDRDCLLYTSRCV